MKDEILGLLFKPRMSECPTCKKVSFKTPFIECIFCYSKGLIA